jgi:hypothetical protein
MPKYYEEGQPFKFILDEDPEVIPVDENPSRIKINQVSNVIPLLIDCDIDGESHKISGYIDYETQRIIISDTSNIPDMEDFKERVILFLRQRAMKYSSLLNKDIPPEAYEQLEKGRSYGNPKNMKPDDFRRNNA